MLVVVRLLVVVCRVRSWDARDERAAWVVLRSCRRRVISSLFVEEVDVGPGFDEVKVEFLRSARRVSVDILVSGRGLEAETRVIHTGVNV